MVVSAFDYRFSRDLEMPSKEFAHGVRDICNETGALLILDDVRAGFRLSLHGSWQGLHGINPDLLCYSKAIANGYALSALLGSESCRPGAEKVFATGSFWFSAGAQAAALATLDILKEENVIAKIDSVGKLFRSGLLEQAEELGLTIQVSGPSSMPYLTFKGDKPFERPRGMTFSSECCRLGVLIHPHHNWFLSLAHSEEVINDTLQVTRQAMIAVRDKYGIE